MDRDDADLRTAIREQWRRLGESYIRFRRSHQGYNELVEVPVMRELLGNVSGVRLLDAGCGTGEYARHCARHGATVTGVDISPRLLLEARRLAAEEGLNIDFHEADIEEMTMFGNSSFDAIICSVVIAGRLHEILAEFRRVLLPRGRLYLSDVHPMFNSGRQEVADGTPCLVVSSYFQRTIRSIRNPFGAPNGDTDVVFSWRHFTLQDYFEALADNGFVVERFLEPQPRLEGDSDKLARANSYPVFFLLKARKENVHAGAEAVPVAGET